MRGESFRFHLWGRLRRRTERPAPHFGGGRWERAAFRRKFNVKDRKNLPVKQGVSMKTAGAACPTRLVKQDWEKLYRAAVLESQPSRLLERVKEAEDAILERFESLSGWPGNHRREHDAL